MTAEKKSVYVVEPALEIIGRDPDSLSGRINAIVIRYGGIIREGTPALTLAEWSAICDALNGTYTGVDHLDMARLLWADIADADGLGDKWGIDSQVLALRIRDMSYVERVSILEVVERFWSSPRLNEISTDELLRESGAQILADS
jgi:hypothetical protein